MCSCSLPIILFFFFVWSGLGLLYHLWFLHAVELVSALIVVSGSLEAPEIGMGGNMQPK